MDFDQGPARDTRVVGTHITCTRCGYDLHTLAMNALCPECAQSVEQSLQEHARRSIVDPPLSQTDPAWLRQLLAGTHAFYWSAGIAVIAGWIGLVQGAQGFWYGLIAIPPWVISTYGVWKLTMREPERESGTRDFERWVLRGVAIFFMLLPIFMIRPGYLRSGETMISESWSPVSEIALDVGSFTPIAAVLLMIRCAHLARRAGSSSLLVQFTSLLAAWPVCMFLFNLDFPLRHQRYYSPLISFYDIGGAAGVGHLGMLAPLLRNLHIYNWVILVDGVVSLWFLAALFFLHTDIVRIVRAIESKRAYEPIRDKIDRARNLS